MKNAYNCLCFLLFLCDSENAVWKTCSFSQRLAIWDEERKRQAGENPELIVWKKNANCGKYYCYNKRDD